MAETTVKPLYNPFARPKDTEVTIQNVSTGDLGVVAVTTELHEVRGATADFNGLSCASAPMGVRVIGYSGPIVDVGFYVAGRTTSGIWDTGTPTIASGATGFSGGKLTVRAWGD